MGDTVHREWDRCPWGRKLHLLTYRLPPRNHDGADWELERGFHLQVVGADLFELSLKAREESEAPTLSLLEGATLEGQDRFLILHCPHAYHRERLHSFAESLQAQFPHHVGLILSHSSERFQSLIEYRHHRSNWKNLTRPVIQVFQDYPEADFFSVEKSLFDLGRIGRRLQKLTKLRRLLPW